MNDRTRNAAGDDGEHPFHDVRAFYRSGEEILLSSLPTATSRVIARRATGEDIEAELARPAPGLQDSTEEPTRCRRWTPREACLPRS